MGPSVTANQPTTDEKDDYDAYLESFTQADFGKDGHLSVDEFKIALALHMGKLISMEEAMASFQVFDKNGNGLIDLHEYIGALKYIKKAKENECSVGKACNSSRTFILEAANLIKADEKIMMDGLAEKLWPYRRLLCYQQLGIVPQESKRPSYSLEGLDYRNPDDPDFDSPYSPAQMRCLALVSHNNMKASMKEFVVQNANVLKKFRLTGTASTMTMLHEVFKGDPRVVYGATCMSGPLGGDAQLVAQMCSGLLGGMIFFQDPMESHAHDVDIACLNRQALIYNVPSACNPSTALMMIGMMRMALMNNRPELMPSFFFSLECPSVQAYKKQQAAVVAALK